MPPNLVTAEERAWILDLFTKGASPEEIATHSNGRQVGHIRKILTKAGLYKPTKLRVRNEEKQRIIDLYLSGMSCTDVEKETGRGMRHIARIVSDAGVSRGHLGGIQLGLEQGKGRKEWPNPISVGDVDRMEELYQQGLSSNDVGKLVGRGGRVVREYLAERGATRTLQDGVRRAVSNGKIRTVGKTMDPTFFDTLTPESAWVLGLIFGDGHIRRVDGCSFTLAGSEEVCTKVAALINPSLHVRKIPDTECWAVQWSSWEMAVAVEKYGLYGGNKARSIRLPQISEELMGHFLRGFWDAADGHWERRGNSLSSVIGLASKGMIDDLQALLGGRVSAGVTELDGKFFDVFRLHLRVGETESLVRKIYQDSRPELRCSRKYNIVQLYEMIGEFP